MDPADSYTLAQAKTCAAKLDTYSEEAIGVSLGKDADKVKKVLAKAERKFALLQIVLRRADGAIKSSESDMSEWEELQEKLIFLTPSLMFNVENVKSHLDYLTNTAT